MKNRLLWIAALALSAGIAFAAGRYIGRCEAAAIHAGIHTMSEVSTLRCLYSGDTNGAAHNIEFNLDSDTCVLAKARARTCLLCSKARYQLYYGSEAVMRWRHEHPRNEFIRKLCEKVEGMNGCIDDFLREQ